MAKRELAIEAFNTIKETVQCDGYVTWDDIRHEMETIEDYLFEVK